MSGDPFTSLYFQVPKSWADAGRHIKRRSKRMRQRMKRNQTLQRVYVAETMRIVVPTMPIHYVRMQG